MGTVVPMLAALVAVPWLMRYLGQERLGVLSLVWVVVGYFSFLDMGLGRAVTVAVASFRVEGKHTLSDEICVVGSASVLLFCLGGIAAMVLGCAIVGWGVPFRLTSEALKGEVTVALLWTLPSLPLLLLSSALRGHLEGVGAFRILNLLRIPTGVFLVLGPCLTAYFWQSLVWACVSILIVRTAHALVLWHLVAQQTGHDVIEFLQTILQSVSRSWLRRLLTFGGWVTVSNVVGPVIVYVDRFVIGATLAAGAVTAYAVPFDLVSRLPILVASLCSVLLPELTRLSSMAAAKEPDAARRANQLVRKSSGFSWCVVSVLVIAGYFVIPSALNWWLGAEFARQSTLVTQILLMAFGVNAVAQIPFTALQAVGKVRAVALLHSAELLPYAVLVFFAISWLGLVGAAWAWLLRSIVDYGVLVWMWHLHTGRTPSAIKI
jgi:O-antigen/teichoic acid export membrane protein